MVENFTRTTMILPRELNLEWQDRARRLGVNRQDQIVLWVEQWLSSLGSAPDDAAGESRFVQRMQSIYRRTPPEKRASLQAIMESAADLAVAPANVEARVTQSKNHPTAPAAGKKESA